ncbi:aspartyl/asparaginyl beta-hydroxylase domain-containing protein [Swingsia samuiensis]|nr:aspartyl/asparaginyl beta-hydroxylase domain-containing protein [Swingsia samuiensis]
MTKNARRPLLIRIGKYLRPVFNRILAHYSLFPNEPVLDPYDLPWVKSLEQHGPQIRQEWERLNQERDVAPPLKEISPDHARIADDQRWKSFFLYGYGFRVAENCAKAPFTAALASRIPNLNSAFFSILDPGAEIPPHFGVTKGLLTCHLGVSVPRKREECWINVDGQKIEWENDRCILFDDTYEHWVKNNTDEQRVVLLIQILRPERSVGKLLQKLFMTAIRKSAFVKDARKNFSRWSAAHNQMERI